MSTTHEAAEDFVALVEVVRLTVVGDRNLAHNVAEKASGVGEPVSLECISHQLVLRHGITLRGELSNLFQMRRVLLRKIKVDDLCELPTLASEAAGKGASYSLSRVGDECHSKTDKTPCHILR
jgi:hypothetical protein